MSSGGFGQPPGGGGGFGQPPGGGGFGQPAGGQPPAGGGFGQPPGGPPGGGGFGQPPGGPPAGGGYGPPPGGGGFGQPPPGGGGPAFGSPAPAGPPGEPLKNIPFTPAEESNIGGAGRFMLVAGVVNIVAALVGVVKTGIQLWATSAMEPVQLAGAACGNLITVALAGVFGGLLIMGSRALTKVVTTDENDQVYLVEAMDWLRKVFALKAVLVVGFIAVMCLAMIVGAGAAVAMGAQH